MERCVNPALIGTEDQRCHYGTCKGGVSAISQDVSSVSKSERGKAKIIHRLWVISSIVMMEEGQKRLFTLPDGHLGKENGGGACLFVVSVVSAPGSAACWSDLVLLGGSPASLGWQSCPLLKNQTRPAGILEIAKGMNVGL